MVENIPADLRAKLHGVGRLDIMDVVNARAMAYYDSKGSIANLPDDNFERRQRILHAMATFTDIVSAKLALVDHRIAKLRQRLSFHQASLLTGRAVRRN